jgi:PAS domain S-box-containing protein
MAKTTGNDSRICVRTENDVLQDMIYNAVNMHLVYLDRDFNFVKVNRAYAETCGYKPEEMVGKNHFTLYPDKENQAIFQRVIDTGVAAQFKNKPFIFPDQPARGVTYWDWALAPIKNNVGTVIGLVFSLVETTERKKAELALSESEERFRLAEQVAHVGTFEWNIQTGVNKWTPELEAMYGLPTGSFPGTQDAWEQLVYPEDRQEAVKQVSEAIEKGHFEAEFRVAWPDGSLHWMFGRGWVFKDSTGKPLRLIGINIDITERKKVEKALEKSEEKFAKAFNNSPTAITLTRLTDGKIVDVNDSALELLGHNREELIGHTVIELQIWANPIEREKFSEELKERGFISNREIALQRKDRALINAIASSTLIDIEGDQYLLTSVIDITERKKTEEAFARSNQRFKEILEVIQDAFYVIDRDWKIVFINKQLSSKLGKQLKDLVGKNFWETFPNYRGTIVEENFRWTMEKREIRRFETEGKYTDVYYAATVYPSTEGITVFGVNITQQKQAELTLRAYQANLERLVDERTKQLKNAERLAAIGATAGMVGHDIRNPLQAITGDLFLAEADLAFLPNSAAKEGIRESLASIENNVFYINKIVSDLQDYARPLTPSVRETDLETVFNDVLIKKAIPDNIQFSRKVDMKARMLITDPDILKRILANLVNNAVQAMPKGGKLTVYATKKSEEVIIIVEDTGVGIPEEVKGNLFTPMFTTKSKGQGFGLAVVKRLTEALGGKVSFESKIGNGTKFIIELPLS